MNAEVVVGFTAIVVSAIAVIVAPIIALKIQRRSDAERADRDRKLWIFKTLMSNRATRLNPLFVQALNMIDIEFTGDSDGDVRDAWKELLDHYNDWGKKSPETRKADDKGDLRKADDLLAALLVQMGKILRYNFDKVYVKKGYYYPEGLGNIEQEQQTIRAKLINLLSGQGTKLPVAVFTQDFQPLSVAAPVERAAKQGS